MAVIIPRNAAEHTAILTDLLAFAGPRAHEVRTVTHGPRLAFQLPDDLYDAWRPPTAPPPPDDPAAAEPPPPPAADPVPTKPARAGKPKKETS